MSRRAGSLAVLALLLGLTHLAPAAEPKHPLLGEPAPSFRLKSLDGKTVSLEEMRGRVVVLHFGAGW